MNKKIILVLLITLLIFSVIFIGHVLGEDNNNKLKSKNVEKLDNFLGDLILDNMLDNLYKELEKEHKPFNYEGHGYFVVKGNSMTPNFYDGDIVKLVSEKYNDGDFVAVTFNTTGENLIKKYISGELVSTNSAGRHFKDEEVTLIWK